MSFLFVKIREIRMLEYHADGNQEWGKKMMMQKRVVPKQCPWVNQSRWDVIPIECFLVCFIRGNVLRVMDVVHGTLDGLVWMGAQIFHLWVQVEDRVGGAEVESWADSIMWVIQMLLFSQWGKKQGQQMKMDGEEFLKVWRKKRAGNCCLCPWYQKWGPQTWEDVRNAEFLASGLVHQKLHFKQDPQTFHMHIKVWEAPIFSSQ